MLPKAKARGVVATYLLDGAAQIPHTEAFTPILKLFRGGTYIACNKVIPSTKHEREVDTVFSRKFA